MQTFLRSTVLLVTLLLGCHSEYRKECGLAGNTQSAACERALQDADRAAARSRQLRNDYQFAEAEAALTQALNLQREALGSYSYRAVNTLLDMSRLHGDQGKLLLSLVLLDQAVRTLDKIPRKDPDALVDALKYAARLYSREDRLYKAKELFEKALAELEKAPQKNRTNRRNIPIVALELSDIHDELDQEEQAEAYIRKAIRSLNQAENDVSLKVAVFTQLGDFYDKKGAHERALEVWEDLLAFQRRKGFEEYLSQSAIYAKAAWTNLSLKNFERAKEYIIKAKMAFRRYPVEKLDDCSSRTLHRIALLAAQFHEYIGELDDALSLYVFAIRDILSTSGFRGRETELRGRDEIQGIARVLYRQGKFDEAKRLFWLSAEMHEEALLLNGVSKSEHLLEQYIIGMSHQDNQIYTFSGWPYGKDSLKELELALTLLHQGRATDLIAQNFSGIQQGLSPADTSALAKLRFARQRYAEHILRGRGDGENSKDYERLMDELSAQISQQEEELARRQLFIGSWSRKNQLKTIVKDVAAQLSEGDVLISFVTYVPTWGTAEDEVTKKDPVYKALLLWPDGRIEAVPLGTAASIDRSIAQLSAQLASKSEAYQEHARSVYQQVVWPLTPFLKQAKRIYLSLDGQLHLVPFHILPDHEMPLGDRFELVYLSSGRDLLLKPAPTTPGKEVVVFADPDFGAAIPGTSESAPRTLLGQHERERAQVRMNRHDRLAFPDLARLPGTRAEADAIHEMIPHARVLTDAQATEGAMLRLRAPAILHIATHGFFLGEDNAPRGRSPRSPSQFEEIDPPIENLMLRSGLLMAGASRKLRPEKADPLAGDGIATALELAGMNLSGTQLVVLSACESGKGSIREGQGVYGLRRAFFTSGAQTLVTSLWKVDDAVTAELMRELYSRLLRGEGRAAALRNAAVEIRKRHPHPYYWAAFINIGQSGPLSGVLDGTLLR